MFYSTTTQSKTIQPQLGQTVSIRYNDNALGNTIGVVQSIAENIATVDTDSGQISLDMKHYTFGDELTEAERALAVRRKKQLDYIPPTRLLATVKAVQNFKREGISEDVLRDPDLLYGLLKKEFVLFNLIPDRERRKTVEAVMKKMKLYEDVDAKIVIAEDLVPNHKGTTARDMLFAFTSGSSLSEVAARFTDVSNEDLGNLFIGLIENNIIPKQRMMELGRVPVIANNVIKSRLCKEQ